VRAGLALLFVAAAGVAGRWLPPRLAGDVDFVEYAAAARVLLAGGDPYDARSLLPHQAAAGWPHPTAIMMWNPPWVFPLVLPAGLPASGPAFAAWAAAQLVAVCWAAAAAWRLYGGPRRWTPLVVLLAAAFPPTFFLVCFGQMSGFAVAGLVGFLAGLRANRPADAGVALALTAVKPHLLLPFAALLACVAATHRPTRIAAVVGGLVLVAAALFPMLWNPHVWADWLAATRAPTDAFHLSPADWDPPILAAELSKACGNSLAVQFAPSAAAAVLLVARWWQRRQTWDWERELPAVVLVCLLTTGYGAWGFDLVLLLLPLAQAAAWAAADGRARLILWALLVFLAGCASVYMALLPILWWTPAVAAGYGLVALIARPGQAARAAAR